VPFKTLKHKVFGALEHFMFGAEETTFPSASQSKIVIALKNLSKIIDSLQKPTVFDV
jgi:hypothetical protein